MLYCNFLEIFQKNRKIVSKPAKLLLASYIIGMLLCDCGGGGGTSSPPSTKKPPTITTIIDEQKPKRKNGEKTENKIKKLKNTISEICDLIGPTEPSNVSDENKFIEIISQTPNPSSSFPTVKQDFNKIKEFFMNGKKKGINEIFKKIATEYTSDQKQEFLNSYTIMAVGIKNTTRGRSKWDSETMFIHTINLIKDTKKQDLFNQMGNTDVKDENDNVIKFKTLYSDEEIKEKVKEVSSGLLNRMSTYMKDSFSSIIKWGSSVFKKKTTGGSKKKDAGGITQTFNAADALGYLESIERFNKNLININKKNITLGELLKKNTKAPKWTYIYISGTKYNIEEYDIGELKKKLEDSEEYKEGNPIKISKSFHPKVLINYKDKHPGIIQSEKMLDLDDININDDLVVIYKNLYSISLKASEKINSLLSQASNPEIETVDMIISIIGHEKKDIPIDKKNNNIDLPDTAKQNKGYEISNKTDLVNLTTGPNNPKKDEIESKINDTKQQEGIMVKISKTVKNLFNNTKPDVSNQQKNVKNTPLNKGNIQPKPDTEKLQKDPENKLLLKKEVENFNISDSDWKIIGKFITNANASDRMNIENSYKNTGNHRLNELKVKIDIFRDVIEKLKKYKDLKNITGLIKEYIENDKHTFYYNGINELQECEYLTNIFESKIETKTIEEGIIKIIKIISNLNCISHKSKPFISILWKKYENDESLLQDNRKTILSIFKFKNFEELDETLKYTNEICKFKKSDEGRKISKELLMEYTNTREYTFMKLHSMINQFNSNTKSKNKEDLDTIEAQYKHAMLLCFHYQIDIKENNHFKKYEELKENIKLLKEKDLRKMFQRLSDIYFLYDQRYEPVKNTYRELCIKKKPIAYRDMSLLKNIISVSISPLRKNITLGIKNLTDSCINKNKNEFNYDECTKNISKDLENLTRALKYIEERHEQKKNLNEKIALASKMCEARNKNKSKSILKTINNKFKNIFDSYMNIPLFGDSLIHNDFFPHFFENKENYKEYYKLLDLNGNEGEIFHKQEKFKLTKGTYTMEFKQYERESFKATTLFIYEHLLNDDQKKIFQKNKKHHNSDKKKSEIVECIINFNTQNTFPGFYQDIYNNTGPTEYFIEIIVDLILLYKLNHNLYIECIGEINKHK